MNEKKRTKERLDNLLVSRNLADTRNQARALILAGEAVVNDHRVDKPGTLVSLDADIRLKSGKSPYVSRGGIKLQGALEKWPVSLQNTICIDVGACTGGFTDVLLRNGAQKVYAVDVGHGQLDWRLIKDPRVENHERTHIVKVPVGTFLPPPSIACIDVSFISLEKVLPAVLPHLSSPATLYVLIKPQFEVGPHHIEKGGIVRDETARIAAVNRIITYARTLGLYLIGSSESPITGMDGNREHLAAFSFNLEKNS